MTRLIRTSVLAVTLLALTACGAGGTSTSDRTGSGMALPGNQSLLVVGDWGSGTEAQVEVAAQMKDYAQHHAVGAIVTTGDNFYSDNASDLMKPFAWATEGDIPFLISWGNHDVDSQRRIELIDDTFGDPPRWWSHDWGPVDIVILDSTQIDSRQQRRFLVDALTTGDDPTIVVSHHPPYSCGSHGNTQSVLTDWVPLFDDDVFVVISGHEHNYQRFESDDVTYLVTGGGGQSLTELADCSDDHPRRIAGEAVHNFVALELTDSLNVTAIDAEGEVIDEFSLGLP
ncbi:MAG TPA: metallophosphoesterase [Acidimicrobiia bacterium]